MKYIGNTFDNVATDSGRRAEPVMDIEQIMDRYGLNLSAARVLRLIERLVRASRQKGVKDLRGLPYCYASKEWIAGQIGKSLRTVARAIKDLKASGLIECKRTRSNAMLFISGDVYGAAEAVPVGAVEAEAEAVPVVEKASCGVESDKSVMSGSDTNGTSNILTKSINNNTIQSVDLSPRAKRVRRVRLARKPGNSRASRFSREQFEADRRRLYEQFEQHLIQSGAWDSACIPAIRYISDLVAEGLDVRVNGVNISARQYWEQVQNIQGDRFCETINAIAERDRQGLIRNKRAYLLSSLYNCALWDRLSLIGNEFEEAQA